VVGFPGGIVFANGRVFVSDMGLFPAAGTLIKVIDPSTGAVVDSVTVHNTPGGMTVANGRIFVACVGTGKVYRIHPTSLAVEDSVQLPAVSGDLVSSGDTLFVLGFNAVAKLYANPLTIIDTTLIDMLGGMYFYALSFDESVNELYVSNIVSPGGAGQVEIYTTSGILRRSPMLSGIFPGAFAFKR
jgi:outer membrane protein assembly factor BamB